MHQCIVLLQCCCRVQFS